MEQTLEIIGTLVGLLYLWLEYRASIYLWIAGIIMPAIYIFVYYNAGLYADFGINIYYLGAAIYGWMMWKYGAFLRRTILKSQGICCRLLRYLPLRLPALPGCLSTLQTAMSLGWTPSLPRSALSACGCWHVNM